jgi:hypothetical protein
MKTFIKGPVKRSLITTTKEQRHANGLVSTVEHRCEKHEETGWQFELIMVQSHSRKGIAAQILKAITKSLKWLFLRLLPWLYLLWLHLPFPKWVYELAKRPK